MFKYLLLLVCVYGQIYAQEFVPFSKEGKFGFKSQNTVVIEPKFQYVCIFTDGLALVKYDNLWGYIDSTGEWKIKPQFEKAQPFLSGLAIVVLNGQTGIIQLDGKYKVKPQYKNFIEEDNGYKTFTDLGKGYIYKASTSEIPAKYEELTEASVIISGKTKSGTWDIYLEGKVILKDASSAVNYSDVDHYRKTFLLSVANKVGVYHFEKGWIVQPNYQEISTIDFFDYPAPDNQLNYNTIYKLTKSKVNIDLMSDQITTIENDSIQFAKMTGELITPLYFNSGEAFTSYDTENEIQSDAQIVTSFQFSKNGKIGLITPEFTVKQTEYITIVPFLNFKIGKIKYGKDYLLSNDYTVIDSFKTITPYKEYLIDANLEYDYQAEIYPYSSNNTDEPIVIISQPSAKNELNSVYALYSLEERKIISPWMDKNPTVNMIYNNGNNNILYVYSISLNAEDATLFGFYTKGMSSPTALIYEYVINDGSSLISLKKIRENKVELLKISENGVSNLLTSENIFLSSLWKVPATFIPEETEPYEVGVFTNEFLLIKNNNKYGLICQNEKIIPAEYDTLIQNSYNTEIINLYKGKLIGYVNLFTGDFIAPISKAELTFNYDQVFDFTYAKTGTTEQDYYITSKGKKFYTDSPERSIFKNNGMYGLSSYSEFTDSEDQTIVVPAIYKEIQITYYDDKYLVKNDKKKYGIINTIGDTLIPLKYTKIEEKLLYSNETETIYNIYNGKKRGLFSIKRGEIIPPVFEKIGKIYDDSIPVEGFLTQIGNKKGYYHPTGEEIVPCEFESIECLNHSDEYFKTMASRKNGKWYVWNYAQWEQNTFTPFDYSLGFEFILGDYGYIKNASSYNVYNLFSKEIVNENYTGALEISNDLYSLFSINSKCGIKSINGPVLIEPIYDKIQFHTEINKIRASKDGVQYIIDLITNERTIEINEEY